MTNKKLLSALIMMALTTSVLGSVYAADESNGDAVKRYKPYAAAEEIEKLPDIVVIGDRNKEREVLPGDFVYTKSQTGFFSGKDTLDIPFTQTNFTEKSMEMFTGPDKPMDSLLANSPSIRQSGSILHGDFFFRGFRTNGTNFYVNNVPGVFTQFNTPLYPIESLEMISGPNVGIYGTGVQYETTNPGGIISVKTKVAPDNRVFDFTQTISGRGLFGEYLDYGERFGKNKEWGIRITTENLNGRSSVKGTKINGQGIFANIDHQSEKSKDSLFIGYRNLDIQGGLRWFILDSSVTKLPGVPKGSNDYSFDGMVKSTHGWLMTYNHEQKFNEHWDGFANFGMQRNDLDRNVMANGGSGYVLKEDGTFPVTARPGGTPQEYYYWQLGTTAHYNTGDINHDITLSYNQAWRNRKTAYNNGSLATIGSGSLYDGINQILPAPTKFDTRWSNKTRVESFSIIDYMTYEKWNVIFGFHKHEATSKSYKYSGNTSNWSSIDTIKTDATSPTYGFIYHPNDNSSIYASHTENFDAGSGVNTTFENYGDVLPPLKTKQNEIGFKYLKDDLLWTLAYYDIKQDNLISVYKTGYSKPFQSKDGQARHKGLELAVNGKLADKWNLFGGISRMSAKQEKTTNGTLDGVRVNGTSEWTAVFGAEYNPNEFWSFVGRGIYTGRSPVMNEKIWAGGYTIFDVGATYKTHFGEVPAELSLMVNNVFNKDYWQVSRGNQIYLSLPRTLTFTAKLHF